MAGIRVSRSKVIDKTREMDQQLGGAKVAAERTMQALLLVEEESGTLIGEAWDSVRDYVEQIQRPLNSLYINWINAQFEGNRKLRDEASYLPVEDMQEDYFKSQIRHYRTIIARERKKEFPNHTLIHYCKKKIDMYEQFLNMLYNFVSRTDSAYDKAEYYLGLLEAADSDLEDVVFNCDFLKINYAQINRVWAADFMWDQLKAIDVDKKKIKSSLVTHMLRTLDIDEEKIEIFVKACIMGQSAVSADLFNKYGQVIEKAQKQQKENESKDKIAISQIISNEAFLIVTEILRRRTVPIPEYIIKKHKSNNLEKIVYARELLGKEILSEEYIENQEEWKEIEFGMGFEANMSYSGCEVIATYNAKKALGEKVTAETMTDLIGYYERDGVMLSGEFGVSPLAIDEYFEKEGYDTIMLANDVSENLESLALASDVVILSVYNNKYSICDQVHTICVTKEKRAYCAHNVYHKENKEYAKIGPYKTIQEVVENLKDHHNSAVISAIGINKMRGEEK